MEELAKIKLALMNFVGDVSKIEDLIRQEKFLQAGMDIVQLRHMLLDIWSQIKTNGNEINNA